MDVDRAPCVPVEAGVEEPGVVGEDVEPQEPDLALDAIEGRVPLYGLPHVGHVAHDERVEAAPERARRVSQLALYHSVTTDGEPLSGAAT
jgi:hypothetical protein